MLTHMRNALRCIRVEKMSTTAVCKSFCIPTRTLRRYVNFSKNPEDKLFYMDIEEDKEKEEERGGAENEEYNSEEEEEEEQQEEDVPISWKPKTAVPMFTMYTDDDTTCASPVAHSVTDCAVFDTLDESATTAISTSDLFDSLFQDFCHDIVCSDVF